MAGVYYQAHALRGLGRADWGVHADSPTAMTYAHPDTKARTFVAWNPTAKPRTVRFFEHGTPLGSFVVPARGLASTRTLTP